MIVILLLLIACGVSYYVYVSSKPGWSEPPEPPPTEEELLQARLDLHRIERGVDVALAREEAHRQGRQTKEAIAEAMENER